MKFTVYEFGYANTSKKIYDDIIKALPSSVNVDRAGSAVLEKKRELTRKLEEIHGRTLEAKQSVAWGSWATWILRQKDASHETLMHEGPPIRIAHFFRPVMTQKEIQAEQTREQDRILLDLVTGIENRLNQDFQQMIKFITGYREALAHSISRQTAIARENEVSQDLADLVCDQDDIDHMDSEDE